MNLKQLLYFITVVEEGNITAASKKLHIAQPALSTQITNLEKELDIILFHRGPRKITLTNAGEILLAKANSMFELKKSIKKDLEDHKSGSQGTLKIGTISAIDADLLENNFLKFHKKYNKIKYEIFEGITPEIIQLLYARTIEVGVVRTPFDTTGLETIYLKSEPMIVAYSKNYEIAGIGGKVTIEEIDQKPLIIYRRFQDVIRLAFQESEITPNILCINDDSRTSLLWANAGLGIAIVPISSKSLVLANNLRYKKIDHQSLHTRMVIVTLENSNLSTVATNFVAQCKKNIIK